MENGPDHRPTLTTQGTAEQPAVPDARVGENVVAGLGNPAGM